MRREVCDHGHAPVADEREHEGRASHVHDRHGLCAQERRGASSARQRARARMQGGAQGAQEDRIRNGPSDSAPLTMRVKENFQQHFQRNVPRVVPNTNGKGVA